MRNLLRAGVVFLTLSVAAPAGAGVAIPIPCQGGTISLQSGSTLDLGWTGAGHDAELVSGSGMGFVVQRKCTISGDGCVTNGDCGDGECVATCDCDEDTTCDIKGPVGERHCLTTLEVCSNNSDCPESIPCLSNFGPPQPLVSVLAPICVVADFAEPFEGAANLATGDVSLSAQLRWRVYLGISTEAPCPRCGAPGDSPAVGDTFQCEGGQRDGEECHVDGVTQQFGGVSFDCAPTLASNITGAGVTLPLRDLTTGTTSKTAELPCKFFGFTANPLHPETSPKCSDHRLAEDPVCTSNADCLRCSGDPAVACASNTDCTDKGTCAEAPDQPIACGFWCHCGFCNGNAAFPCSADSECPEGQSCDEGPGTMTQANAPQQRPNDCETDQFICGGNEPEQCATTTSGFCSEKPLEPCSNDETCAGVEGGTCVFAPRSCFESRIVRSGSASPLGSYCAFENKTCASNTDCLGADDFCLLESAHPAMASVMCVPATASSVINATRGLTGPAATSWKTLLKICRCGALEEPGCQVICNPGCGNGIVEGDEACDGGPCCEDDCTLTPAETPCRAAAGDCDVAEACTGASILCPVDAFAADGTLCDDGTACTTGDVCAGGQCEGASGCGNSVVDEECGETCDDGNTADGDGCSSVCVLEQPCGDANDDGEILASDAQLILQKAVGLPVICPLSICDVDSSGVIRTNDALRTLRKAVGLPGDLDCNPAA